MVLEVDLPIPELIRQVLNNCSVQYLLYHVAVIERAPDAEEWANACTKLLDKGEE